MNKSYLILQLIIALMFLSSMVFAQTGGKDYIVFIAGDTLYCEINSVKQDVVKVVKDGEKFSFPPDSVFRIFQHSKNLVYAPSYLHCDFSIVKGLKPYIYFVADKDKKKLKFFKLSIDGDIMVFDTQKYIRGPNFVFFAPYVARKLALKKSTGEIIPLTVYSIDPMEELAKERKITLKRFFADKTVFLSEFENDKDKSIDATLNFIKKYNEISSTNNP